MSISKNINKVLSQIPKQGKLVAVSKTKPIELIKEAYDGSYRIFGENKALELRDKSEALPKDIEWHFIGHLQTNKVKYIIPQSKLIHSVESFKLLNTINKESKKNNIITDCLLQFHIATEQTKFGLNLKEGLKILNSADFKKLENIRVVGVMGMATFTDNKNQIRSEFKNLKSIFDSLKSTFNQPYFTEISMGMSGDYKIAIEEGATIIRVGASIFGNRN